MFFLRNHGGGLVNLEKTECIYKNELIISGKTVYRIETDNLSAEDGFILGTYYTKEERDKAFKNLMTFLNAMDMREFEEDGK